MWQSATRSDWTEAVAGGRPEGIPESVPVLSVSAHTGQGITALKECLAQLGKTQETSRKIVGDLLSPSDMAVLVVPIDKAAPKGRLILPSSRPYVTSWKRTQCPWWSGKMDWRDTLASLGKKPRMVITDSQVFAKVSADTPEDILLTSFPFSLPVIREPGAHGAGASGLWTASERGTES